MAPRQHCNVELHCKGRAEASAGPTGDVKEPSSGGGRAPRRLRLDRFCIETRTPRGAGWQHVRDRTGHNPSSLSARHRLGALLL